MKRLFDHLLYDPYRAVKRNPYVTVGKSILDKTFKVRMDAERIEHAVSIGDDCILRGRLIFETSTGRVDIGDRVFINTNSNLISRSSITIEDDVTIAWGCTIYDHDSHSVDYRERVKDQRTQLKDWHLPNNMANKNWDVVRSAPIVIKRHAWLGFDVVVLKGVTIGEGAVIGARAVVASDVPPWTVAVGNPARVIKKISKGLE